ncbi:MAG TPA: hypothetical protein VGL40_08490 [Bacillota bacterium]
MKRTVWFLAILLLISTSSSSCSSHVPLARNADRVIILGASYGQLLSGKPAQEFLQSFRLGVDGRAKGQKIAPNGGVRLVIAHGFSSPGRVFLYDEPHKLVSYEGKTYSLSHQFPWPQPQDGVRSFKVGTYGFPGPIVQWLKAKSEEKGAVVGLGGLPGDGKVLLVSAGEQGSIVYLMNADFTDGTWRFMFQYRKPQEVSPEMANAVATIGFVATLPNNVKVEVYEPDAKSKLTGGPVKEEQIPLPKSGPVGPGLADICRSLFSDYLLGYKSIDADDNYRLTDYRVEDVTSRSKSPSNGRLTFLVEYSVLPAIPKSFSNWLPADGQIGSDGWILNKEISVDIIEEGAGYYIQNMGGGGQ